MKPSLTVNLPSAHYPIYVGTSLLTQSSLLKQYVVAKQALIVTNETVAPHYLSKVQQSLSDIQCDVVILPDGEIYKDQTRLFSIYDALLRYDHHRDTTVFALGGGVVGDMAGFAAATYQRGVRLVQLPTTLLAQVDSSVGGKTAINLPQGKNMVGCFYQPAAVIMDLSALQTLPAREFRAGLAEVIKYGLLVGGDFLAYLPSLLSHFQSENFLSTETRIFSEEVLLALSHTIVRCCQIKADMVREDIHDKGGRRALLNLGHTFAHALETATGYQRWLHGEAVAIGLFCASMLSYKLGYLKTADVDLVKALLQQAKLNYLIPSDIDLDVLQALMWRDKKVQAETLPFVVMQQFGLCKLEHQITADQIKWVLSNTVIK